MQPGPIDLEYHHMTMIDNREGFGVTLEDNGESAYDGSLMMLLDNKIYGEAGTATDCPEDESYCKVFDKSGFMLSGVNEAGKGLMP
jgi:hypothetical protein